MSTEFNKTIVIQQRSSPSSEMVLLGILLCLERFFFPFLANYKTLGLSENYIVSNQKKAVFQNSLTLNQNESHFYYFISSIYSFFPDELLNLTVFILVIQNNMNIKPYMTVIDQRWLTSNHQYAIDVGKNGIIYSIIT